MDSINEEARGLLLQRVANSVGESWARTALSALAAEGRSAIGGWPGTISEARERVRSAIDAQLSRAALSPASAGERDSSARLAYARARTFWLASARAEDAFDDGGPEAPTTR